MSAECALPRESDVQFGARMNTAPFVPGLAWLLVCQSIGESLSRLTKLGLPGPVLGMLLLLILLQWDVVRAQVSGVANGLLQHLSLLFVPVGVGVMTHVALLSQYGWQLLIALVLSTWIGLAVTAVVLRALLRRAEGASPASSQT